MSRKIVVFISAVALIGLMLIGNVVAYYWDEDSLENVINVGTIEIDVTETGEDVAHHSNNYVLYPGVTCIKDPKIKIIGESCYLQAQININNIIVADQYKPALLNKYSVTNDNDLKTAIESEIGNIIASEIDKVNFGTADVPIKWVKDNDKDIYYINKKFSEKDIVPLFKSVTIPSSFGNMWKEVSFDVEIVVTAVQAENQPQENDIYINAFKDKA